MKVLVLGGMHGNEPLGLSVVDLIKKMPIKGVDSLVANPLAVKANSRFTSQDLNRSFPGDELSDSYEARRAAEVLAKTQGYDVVLDFHNTYCPSNDCAFVGAEANSNLYDAAWLLGFDKVIVADYDCINKAAPNCLSVEVSMDSTLNVPELWYERIRALALLDEFVVSPEVQRYRFIYRMTLEDKERLKLDTLGLKAFTPLPKGTAKALNIPSPAYPIFIGDRFTPYNYGGILARL